MAQEFMMTTSSTSAMSRVPGKPISSRRDRIRAAYMPVLEQADNHHMFMFWPEKLPTHKAQRPSIISVYILHRSIGRSTHRVLSKDTGWQSKKRVVIAIRRGGVLVEEVSTGGGIIAPRELEDKEGSIILNRRSRMGRWEGKSML